MGRGLGYYLAIYTSARGVCVRVSLWLAVYGLCPGFRHILPFFYSDRIYVVGAFPMGGSIAGYTSGAWGGGARTRGMAFGVMMTVNYFLRLGVFEKLKLKVSRPDTSISIIARPRKQAPTGLILGTPTTIAPGYDRRRDQFVPKVDSRFAK